MMEQTVLQGVKVTKRFGGIVALSEVDFDLAQESIVGLIGPNGSGKTTLFNVISGIFRPDRGSILYEGRDITRLEPDEISSLGIARTFQIVRPLKDLTVVDNVAVGVLYGRGIRGMKEARKEALELLGFTGLAGKKETRAGLLKLADRKRLEVTRALAIGPKLLLLDEVFAGLNQREIDDAIQLIFRIRKEMKMTIFMIEHVMKAIMQTCDRIIALDFGTKVADGAPADVARVPEVIVAYLGAEYAENP